MYGFWFALFSMSDIFTLVGLGFLGAEEELLGASDIVWMAILHLVVLPALAIGYVLFYRGVRRLAG